MELELFSNRTILRSIDLESNLVKLIPGFAGKEMRKFKNDD